MDLNTVEAVVPTADPGEWREGDAWPAVAVGPQGIELAATATVAELYALPEQDEVREHDWPGVDLFRPCCDSFVASFKVWNMSTVGGNLCTSLPAGPMISLCAGLDGTATILGPGAPGASGASSRTVPVAEFVIGDGRNVLAPGELLRSIHLPASALASRVAFRRLSLSNLGRSGVLLIGRLGADGLVLTVTASTRRPVQLRFGAGRFPDSPSLTAALDEAIPEALYHDDIHGLPEWRRDMTYRLAEEIRSELGGPPGTAAGGDGTGFQVSGDFWPPLRSPRKEP